MIHSAYTGVRTIIWETILPNSIYFYSPYIYIHAISKVLIIFILCVIIDRLRIITVEKWFMKLVDYILNKFSDKKSVN